MTINNTDEFYRSKWFQDYFKPSPRSFICKADSPNFEILAVSDIYLSVVDISRENLLGRNIFEVFPDTNNKTSIGNNIAASIRRVIQTGKPDTLPAVKYTIPVAGTDTTKAFYWSGLNEPVFDDKGKVAYIIHTTSNVTEQVLGTKAKEEASRQLEAYQEEQALSKALADLNEALLSKNAELIASRELAKKNEEQFRLVADNISQLVWMADAAGYIYWYNNRWYEYTGTTFEEMKGWGWQKVHHPDYIGPVTDQFKKNLEQGTVFDDTFPLRGADGTYRWFLTRVIPARNEAGEITHWFGSNTDITEQLNARDELVTAYENLKSVTTNLNQAINLALIDLWTVDLATGQLTLTNRSKELHGLSTEEVIDYKQSLQLLSPEHRNVVDDAIQKAISTNSTFTVEYLVLPQDGSKSRWIKSTGQVYPGKDGKAVKMKGIMADITEQKEDEQRKNDFIGMVSHELKTPITSLSAYIQLMQMDAQKGGNSFTIKALDKISNQVHKMTRLINGFLDISRLESGKIHIEQQRFDMKQLVKEIEEETLPLYSSHKIIFHPVETIWVRGDRDKLGQVVTNFISNALKYSPAGTAIQITCVSINGYAQVSVRDEGMGIAPKDLDKLFDRYYRVEGQHMKTIAGFGIGLYVCSEIIRLHNGTIWVESKIGEGSAFFFSIPVID